MTSPGERQHGMYDYEFDPERENDTAAAIFRLAREGGERLLDLGCGRGIVAGALVAEGRHAVGVDNDPELLADAAARGLITIQADLSTDWASEVRPHGPFDVVILADVLEHLRDPGAVLDSIRDNELLAPGGWLIVSIPNASHEALILNLLTDRFTYTDDGLLDRTHIRWFTASSFSEFAEQHGFVRTRHVRVRRTIEQTMHGYLRSELVEALREQLLRNDDHRTYQHIMRFEPMQAASQIAELRRMLEQERKDKFAALERASEDKSAALEHARGEQRATAGELERARLELSVASTELERVRRELGEERSPARMRDLRELQQRYEEQFEARRALFRRNRELERKLEEIYESESFRLGAAMLRVPRRVKQSISVRRRRKPAPPTSSKEDDRDLRADLVVPLHRPRTDIDSFRPHLEVSPVQAAYEAAIDRPYPRTARYRVAMTVSTTDLGEGRGDPYTAIGLGRQLERLGVGVCYLPPERWYRPPTGTDVVLSLLAEPRFGCLDPLRLPAGIRRVAWIRNNTDRWVERGSLELYDGVLCSSERTRRIVDRIVGVPTAVLPIAVDDELFTDELGVTERDPSLVVTINQWGSERHAYSTLAESEPGVPVGIFGTQHGIDPRLTQLQSGKVSYFELPSLYRSAMFVLDDQQEVNRPFNNTNSRIFESILSGAVPLTDTPSGPEVVGLDEVPLWTDAEDLSATIHRLRDDHAARRQLVQGLQATVRSHHTYAHRAQQVDAFISDEIGLEGPPRRTVGTVVGFWPDYRVTNPFQGLLHSELRRADAAAVALEDPLDLLEPVGHRGEHRVLHLHWTAPLLNPCPSDRSARQRLRAILDGLDEHRRRGGQLIWTVHNLLPHESPYPVLEAELRQGIADRADIVHVMCPETVDLAAPHYRLRPDTIRLIEHGSYVAAYPNVADPGAARRRFGFFDDEVVLLTFGQIRPYKGIEDLLDAFEDARKSEPRLRLLVAGKAGKFPGARELIARLEDSDGVMFVHDEIDDDDLQSYYAAADVAVLPYRTGLNSGALQLAFTFGRPVIAPRIGCLPHDVSDDIAIFYPPGLAGLREALGGVSRLLTTEARIAAQGRAAAYTHIEMSRAYAQVVAELVGVTSGPR